MTGRQGKRVPHEDLYWRSYGLEFGDRVRELRRIRGLSQERLAEITGLSRNIVSDIERSANGRDNPGNPRLETVYRLALGLDVPPGALLPAVDELVGREPARDGDVPRPDVAWGERYAHFVLGDGAT